MKLRVNSFEGNQRSTVELSYCPRREKKRNVYSLLFAHACGVACSNLYQAGWTNSAWMKTLVTMGRFHPKIISFWGLLGLKVRTKLHVMTHSSPSNDKKEVKVLRHWTNKPYSFLPLSLLNIHNRAKHLTYNEEVYHPKNMHTNRSHCLQIG